MNNFFINSFLVSLTLSFKAQIHKSSQRLWLVSRLPDMSTVIMRKLRKEIDFLKHRPEKMSL